MKTEIQITSKKGFFSRLKEQIKTIFIDVFIHPLKSAYATNPIEFIGLCIIYISLVSLLIFFILFFTWPQIFKGLFFITIILMLSLLIGSMLARPDRLFGIRDTSLENEAKSLQNIDNLNSDEIPIEIKESLDRFRRDYPDSSKVGFIMMQFGKTEAHNEILGGIRLALKRYGCAGIRADDKEYHDDKYYRGFRKTPIVLSFSTDYRMYGKSS
jgi:hypothetical protein